MQVVTTATDVCPGTSRCVHTRTQSRTEACHKCTLNPRGNSDAVALGVDGDDPTADEVAETVASSDDPTADEVATLLACTTERRSCYICGSTTEVSTEADHPVCHSCGTPLIS